MRKMSDQRVSCLLFVSLLLFTPRTTQVEMCCMILHAADVSNCARPWDVYRKLQYDFYYVKNFSLWLDLLIALSTLQVVITGRGSR